MYGKLIEQGISESPYSMVVCFWYLMSQTLLLENSCDHVKQMDNNGDECVIMLLSAVIRGTYKSVESLLLDGK